MAATKPVQQSISSLSLRPDKYKRVRSIHADSFGGMVPVRSANVRRHRTGVIPCTSGSVYNRGLNSGSELDKGASDLSEPRIGGCTRIGNLSAMLGMLRDAYDRIRRISPRLRSGLIFLFFGLKFKKFGKHTKLFGATALSLGSGVSIGDFCWIEAVTRYAGTKYAPNLRIGNRVAISDLSHISCAKRIVIGDDCLIGSKVYIGDHSHGSTKLTPEILGVPPALRKLGDMDDVEIGEMTWICDGAVILAGSRIAKSSIIAANSVVRLREDRPALIGGAPARVLRYLDGNKERRMEIL